MNYSAIGLMSGSSLDGLDIVWATFQEENSQWSYRIKKSECIPFSAEMRHRLQEATKLDAQSYLLLHTDFGHYCGQAVNRFLEGFNEDDFKPQVIGSHGHTTFHLPAQKMTHQLGDGAAISAITKLDVVSDLRAADVALDGQGAPIVPIGEKYLFRNFRYFMNIGGICNVSVHAGEQVAAFDVAPANRVMNMLAGEVGKPYDEDGALGALGRVDEHLLHTLNSLSYYAQPHPKSLANDFGTSVVYPLIKAAGLSVTDAAATFYEHIAEQTVKALQPFGTGSKEEILLTGGGALNTYLVGRLTERLQESGIEAVVPDKDTLNYKEALIMAFIAVLRLRNDVTVLHTVTGASRDTCGGGLWSVK